jgi:large subunit ribosomal protein L18Ae
LSGRHKAQSESLIVVRATQLKGKNLEKEARRAYTRQLVKEGIKFPILQRRPRPPNKALKTVFKANRPNLFV